MLSFAVTIVLILIRLVLAAPAISLPINAQVPPVAQVSQLFSFTFSASTFSSTVGAITYALSGAPSWLSINSSTRTFTGTPTSSDVGSTTFQLVGSDSTGSTSMSVTLVILTQESIQLGDAILPQLSKIGRTSSPDALLLYPSQAFTIKFDSNTFLGTTSSTNYYATSGNNTPLPSWLDFSGSDLEFTGTSPSLVTATSYPQVYPVRLMASDVVGFAGATAMFNIVVEYGVLYFNVTYQSFAVKSGEYFQSSSLLDELQLNDQSAQSSNISSVTSDAPSWLTLYSQNISLGGLPPSDATSQNVTVTVTDIYGDVANATINLDFSATSLFSQNISTVNATLGKKFTYSLSDVVYSNVNLTANLNSAASWLTYDDTNRLLSGTVPTDANVGIENVQLSASDGTNTQTETLPINLVRGTTSTSQTSSSAAATSSSGSGTGASPTSQETESPTLTAIGNHTTTNHGRRDLAIVLGVLLPILVLLLLFLVILCCIRRRRRQRDMEAVAVFQKQISRPIPEEDEAAVVTQISANGEVLEKERTRTPDPAPRIELPWAPDSMRKSRARLSKRSSKQGSPLIDPTWGGLISPSPPVPAKSSKRSSKASSKYRNKNRKSQDQQDLAPMIRKSDALNYSRKRVPFRSTQSRTMQDTYSAKRASRPMSLLSSVSSGLPSRLSGMGHGAGGLGPPGYLQVRDSWQNPQTSFPPSEYSRMDSVDLERFPQPPRQSGDTSTIRGSEQGGRPSLRLVSEGSLRGSSLSEERQRYVRDRARDRLESAPRFSSGWSLRPSSSRGSKGVMERMRSPALSSSVYPDEGQTARNTWRTYSKSSSVGASKRPETIASEDEEIIYEEPRRPAPLTLRDQVSYSSGQFNSAESTADSAWEDEEDLEESIGPDGQRRWQVSGNNSPIGSPLERPLNFGDLNNPPGSRPGTSRGYPPPSRGALSARRWRLGERRDKRPVSITETDLQRSQGSQRGNLAFV